MTKALIRCEECGKVFRYKKSLKNHRAVKHLSTNQQVYEESIIRLFNSFSLVTRKKRSSLIRNKRTSFSFPFLESSSVVAKSEEELEVAECLILLSNSTPKILDEMKPVAEAVDFNPEIPIGNYESSCLRNKYGEFECGYLTNEQRQLEEEVTTPVRFKGPINLLGNVGVLDQQNLQKEGAFGSGFLSNDQKLMEETCKDQASFSEDKQEQCKAGEFESGYCRTELGVGTMECTDSDVMKTTGSDEPTIVSQENKHIQCKAGDFESGYCRTKLGVGTMECTDSDVKKKTESDEKNVEHTIVSQENKQGQCKAGDFESGFFRTELGVGTMECTDSDVKKTPESAENNVEYTIVSQENKHEQCKAGDFGSRYCRTELGVGVGTMENTDSDVKKNVEQECRLYTKIFPYYHQTFHRIRKCKNKKNSREKSVEPEDESVSMRSRRHKCSIHSSNLSSVHSLGKV